jgi:dephospho-CoA kinase
MKRIVCVTGGIGSGKSAVCAYLALKGLPIYYSDIRAKEIMVENPSVRKALTSLFGTTVYSNDGELNKDVLAQAIFNNVELKQQLEQIVHPAVHEDFKNWAQSQQAPVVIKETPLAIEKGDSTCQELLVVMASLATRVQRIQARNPEWSIEEITARISNQVSDDEREKKASILVWNDASLDELYHKLDQLLTKWI